MAYEWRATVTGAILTIDAYTFKRGVKFVSVEQAPGDMQIELDGEIPKPSGAGDFFSAAEGQMYHRVAVKGSLSVGSPVVLRFGDDLKQRGPGSVTATVVGPIAVTQGTVPWVVQDPLGVKGKDGATIVLPANPVPVEVENSVAVTGPFLTDAQLRAAPVPVSGFPNPVGVKGKDGATIAAVANPVPVELEGASLVGVKGLDGATIATIGANPVPVAGTVAILGEDGTFVASVANPVPVAVVNTVAVGGTVALDAPTLAALELTGIKGKDGATIALPANPVPVEVENPVTVSGAVTVSGQVYVLPGIDPAQQYASVAMAAGTINITVIPAGKHVVLEGYSLTASNTNDPPTAPGIIILRFLGASLKEWQVPTGAIGLTSVLAGIFSFGHTEDGRLAISENQVDCPESGFAVTPQNLQLVVPAGVTGRLNLTFRLV